MRSAPDFFCFPATFAAHCWSYVLVFLSENVPASTEMRIFVKLSYLSYYMKTRLNAKWVFAALAVTGILSFMYVNLDASINASEETALVNQPLQKETAREQENEQREERRFVLPDSRIVHQLYKVIGRLMPHQ